MLKTLLLLCYTVICAPVQAQDSAALIPPESRLYNGIEHIGYSYKIKGFAYFEQPGKQKGDIIYDELPFTGVPMWYDLVKDQVVIQHFNGYNRIGLVSEKVKEFTLGTHQFIRLDVDSLSLPIGFYELLYDGKAKAVARHSKIINRVLKQEVEEDFEEQKTYYIKKDDLWHSVKSTNSLVSVFGKGVKPYLRRNGIKFKTKPIDAIVKAAAYYDSLNQ